MDSPARVVVVTAALIDTPDKACWVSEAWESLEAQDFQDFRWVVADDASPLPLELPEDPRITYLRFEERAGPAVRRNDAVAASDEQLILPLDADDQLAAGALQSLVERWEPGLFVYGDLQILSGHEVRLPPWSASGAASPQGTVPVTALHERTLWENVGGWDKGFEDGLEDVAYWAEAARRGWRGLHLNQITLKYRKHGAGRTARMKANGRLPAMRARLSALGAAPPPVGPPPPVEGGIPLNYKGRRGGMFRVRGQRREYEVWPGQITWVLPEDLVTFRAFGRGRDFH